MGLILKKSLHSQLYYCNPNKIDYRIYIQVGTVHSPYT